MPDPLINSFDDVEKQSVILLANIQEIKNLIDALEARVREIEILIAPVREQFREMKKKHQKRCQLATL